MKFLLVVAFAVVAVSARHQPWSSELKLWESSESREGFGAPLGINRNARRSNWNIGSQWDDESNYKWQQRDSSEDSSSDTSSDSMSSETTRYSRSQMIRSPYPYSQKNLYQRHRGRLGASDDEEDGSFVGVLVTLFRDDQLQYLQNLRRSESDIMFWGGDLVLRKPVGLAIPDTIQDDIISNFDRLSINYNTVFKFVEMKFHYKDPIEKCLNSDFVTKIRDEANAYNLQLTTKTDSFLSNPSRWSLVRRSVAVAINNPLNAEFKLRDSKCKLGDFTDMYPEVDIPPTQTSVFTVGGKQGTGVKCELTYASISGGRKFSILVGTPFMGPTYVKVLAHSGMNVEPKIYGTFNSLVTIMLGD